MKYMIMMFGDESGMLATQTREWIVEMIQFMHGLNADLEKSGELVTAVGLTDASLGKTVRFADGAIVVSDGPYAEAKESVPGFWIVDVESQERALEIAASIVTVTHGPIEVRQVGDEPPEV